MDWNKNWYGSRYGLHDYDSRDKMTKTVVTFVVKCMVTLKNCRIGIKIGVVVDMDPVIMIVVTKRQKGKKAKRQKRQKKRQKKTKKNTKKTEKTTKRQNK